MKKYLFPLLAVCLICLFSAGCSAKAPKAPAEESAIDVDLTALSGTMVYAEVNDIMTNPDDYLGKTIKISGSYITTYYEETELIYHNILIADALACCQSGIEFQWSGEHSYPEDYPADYTNIETAGVFAKYEELGVTYYYLMVDDITVL